jgi:cytochrome c553
MKTLNTCFAILFLGVIGFVETDAYGQTAANNGNDIAASAATCAGCHGTKGEGNEQTGFPRIAGQSQAYLAHQLTSYANGSRNNQVMMPIAKQLTEQQIAALSAYYASLAAPSPKASSSSTAKSQPRVLKRGQTLAAIGDQNLGVQACANCHGPDGAGEPPAYPYLAGQHAGYLNTALAEWKSGARDTDPSRQMSMIAKRLNQNDIAALSAYYAAQPAPLPETQRSNVPMGSAARPASPGATTQGGSTPSSGVSTEQGEPTSGGSIGPGGGGAASGTGASGNQKKQ